MPKVLIVAYGNPLRSDDGVAWHAAEELQGRFGANEVEILVLQQLGPELAETISQCEGVVFVDAASSGKDPGEIQIIAMNSSLEMSEAPRFCHALPPVALLGLAERLYGAKLKAYSATIEGQSFEHGEALTPEVSSALPDFVSRIRELVGTLLIGEQIP